MNIFRTRRAYVIAFGAYFLSLLIMVRTFRSESAPDIQIVAHPSVVKVVVALFCSIFFIGLIHLSSIILERIIFVASSLYFLLWALETLSGYGYWWAMIPNNLTVSVAVSAMATVLAGVRTAQIVFDKKNQPHSVGKI